jgi:ABC-type microcin C transport system duplicated ATPase subunit YejF
MRLPRKERRAVLGRKIGSVFQDPFTALNPALRIGRQIVEPICAISVSSRSRRHGARWRYCTRWASSEPGTSLAPFPISLAAA